MGRAASLALGFVAFLGCREQVADRDAALGDEEAVVRFDARRIADAPRCEECAGEVPRPVAPLSTATVTTQHPTLRWALASPRIDGARVQLCRDRACTHEVASADVTGTRVTLVSALRAGVYFWRLYARRGVAVGAEPSATWQFVVGAHNARIESANGAMFDVNGDGFADLAVGSPGADRGRGRAFVFLGSAMGITPTPATELIGPDEPDARFGMLVAGAGDVNGDGFADLSVSLAHSDGRGEVRVFHGSAAGLIATPASVLRTGEGGGFGCASASAGDVNGDGYADLAVGATREQDHPPGHAYVFLGSAAGIDGERAPAYALSNEIPESHFGSSMGAGDFDGDGRTDLAIGAGSLGGVYPGNLYVHFGCAAARSGCVAVGGAASGIVTGSAATDFAGAVAHARFGALSTVAGDLNGDGYCDLAVTAHGYETPRPTLGTGAVSLYYGDAEGRVFEGFTADKTLRGMDDSPLRFGASASIAGDLNGDGFAELVVGDSDAAGRGGRVHLFSGAAPGIGVRPSATIEGAEAQFGRAVAIVGDTDGDGLADLAVGAPDRGGAGRCYVFRRLERDLSGGQRVVLEGPAGDGGMFGASVW